MEKKYLYRMALVALWMAPLTSLQAAKAVEESRVGLTDDRRHTDIMSPGAKSGVGGNQVWYTGDAAKNTHNEFPTHPVHGLAYADEGGTLTGKKAEEVTHSLGDPNFENYVDKWEFNG